MKIKNKRSFATAIICSALSIFSFIINIMTGEVRFMVSMALLVVLAMLSFYSAYTKQGMLEEIKGYTDERDKYLTMRSSHLLISIMNYVLAAFIFMAFIAYGAWKSNVLLTIAITLCAVLCFMLIAYLLINMYVERKE